MYKKLLVENRAGLVVQDMEATTGNLGNDNGNVDATSIWSIQLFMSRRVNFWGSRDQVLDKSKSLDVGTNS